MQKGFELYLSSFGTFKSIYGTFAAVPIFLIWLQLSWAVILLGGLVAATVFVRLDGKHFDARGLLAYRGSAAVREFRRGLIRPARSVSVTGR